MGKISHEQKIVEQMIRIYCRHKEGNKELCSDCEELLKYAIIRLEKCPFGDAKGSCKRCPIHCYNAKNRAQIRTIMRYSGPRMIIYNPLAAITHLLQEFTQQKTRLCAITTHRREK